MELNINQQISWRKRKPVVSWAVLGGVEGTDSSAPFSPVKSHLECCIQFWSHQYKRAMEILKRVQGRPTKIIKALEHLLHKKSQRDSCDYSAWRRESSEGISSMSMNTRKEDIKMEPASSQICSVKGQDSMDSKWNTECPFPLNNSKYSIGWVTKH